VIIYRHHHRNSTTRHRYRRQCKCELTLSVSGIATTEGVEGLKARCRTTLGTEAEKAKEGSGYIAGFGPKKYSTLQPPSFRNNGCQGWLFGAT
jgi:hypothetical protein